MAVYVYGLTHTDVTTEELAFLQSVDAAKLTAALDRAASDLNAELRAYDIPPADITSANYPDDFEWCRSTVLYGASGFYLRTVTGAEEAASVKLSTFGSRIARFRDRPQLLAAYNTLASSKLTARGPGNYGDTQAAEMARQRFLQPQYPDRWRQ